MNLTQEILKSVCDVIADTNAGLTKSQLKTNLGFCGIACLDDGSRNNAYIYTIGLNKRDWLFNCIAAEWNNTKSLAKFVKFLESVFSPVNFQSNTRLPGMLNRVNDMLIFAGTQVNQKGKIVYTTKKETIDIKSEEKKIEPQLTKEKSYDYDSLKNKLVELSNISDPQKRGFLFEKFLTTLFAEFELKPRKSFRIVGEQIDGSFDYNGEIYLLEAKWQKAAIKIDDIRIFSTKIQDKSAFTRGLFFSYSEFDTYIFTQYNSRGARFILVTVMELYNMLDRKMKLQDFLYQKVRSLAEEGLINKNVFNT